MQLSELHAVDYGNTRLQIDDLVVCGNCDKPSVIDMFGTHELTEKEFQQLPEDVTKDLSFARRAIQPKLHNN